MKKKSRKVKNHGLTDSQMETIKKWHGDLFKDAWEKKRISIEKIELARKACWTLTTPKTRKWLSETGLGSNPDIIEIFAAAGKMMGNTYFRQQGGGKRRKVTKVATR